MEKEKRSLNEELLDAEEVARLLGVGQVTVWRWCRDGSLPCMKLGRYWRIRRSTLDEFLSRSERSYTLVGRLRSFLEPPDNVLAVAENHELMVRLDAAFFRVGEARGGDLIKYYRPGPGSSSVEELRAEMEREGLEVSRLEGEGRLRFIEESGEPGSRQEALEDLISEAQEAERSRPLWVNFNWEGRLELEDALAQQQALAKMVEDEQLVVKTSLLEDELDTWAGREQRRAQVIHAGTVWLSESGLALSRVEPPPAT